MARACDRRNAMVRVAGVIEILKLIAVELALSGTGFSRPRYLMAHPNVTVVPGLQ